MEAILWLLAAMAALGVILGTVEASGLPPGSQRLLAELAVGLAAAVCLLCIVALGELPGRRD